MRTYIVRLVDPSPDGLLHGVVEPLGADPKVFADDAALLDLLRVGARPEPDLNAMQEGAEVGSKEHADGGRGGGTRDAGTPGAV